MSREDRVSLFQKFHKARLQSSIDLSKTCYDLQTIADADDPERMPKSRVGTPMSITPAEASLSKQVFDPVWQKAANLVRNVQSIVDARGKESAKLIARSSVLR